jgi:ABC-2 type transport system ATP-binding protein
MIRRLKADGTAVLLSSHHLDQVQSVCDRVALFNAGVVAVWLSAAGKAGNAPVVAGYVLILAAWLPRLGQRLATWRLSSTQLR